MSDKLFIHSLEGMVCYANPERTYAETVYEGDNESRHKMQCKGFDRVDADEYWFIMLSIARKERDLERIREIIFADDMKANRQGEIPL